MEKLKEELYNELHIKRKDNKIIIDIIIDRYSENRMYGDEELKSLIKASYKEFKLNNAINLFNIYKCSIFINGTLIPNSKNDSNKKELYYMNDDGVLDYWLNNVLAFSIKTNHIRTIETQYEILYREDKTLLW